MSHHRNHAMIREDDYCSYDSRMERTTQPHFPNREDDYCSYDCRMERTTQPHFPNMMKHNEYKVVEEEEACVERPRRGLFRGRPEQMEEFKDKVIYKVTETYY